MYPCTLKIAIGLITLFAASAGSAASIEFREFGPFSVRSTAEGQFSSTVQELRATTSGELQVKYEAPPEHCSPVRMHFLLDGTERGVSEPIAHGRSSGYFDFGAVSAGEHIVGLRAEGLAAGCDSGSLSSWGGFATLRTTVESDTGLDARASSLGAAVFYAMTTSYAWGHYRHGIYVTAAGNVYSFVYESAEREWNPTSDANGRIALFDLQERFSHHPKWLRKLEESQMQNCEAVFAALRDVVPPAAPGGVRYDAPAELRGEYRLDQDSGRYVKVSCVPENK